MFTGEANLAISRELVASLAQSGLRHVVICPGSRSTPLAVAFASRSDVRVWVLVDERSAAYFALGMARQLAAPVAVVCTSGTAAANFFPTVVEASLSRIPLVVLTADRPPELRGWGAAQTIDQVDLFGPYVKWSADLPVPGAEPALLRHARAAAARAMQTATSIPPGPVHLNLPFREPLLPADLDDWHPDGSHLVASTPIPSYTPELISTPAAISAISDLVSAIAGEAKGIIVVGPNETRSALPALAEFAATAGYPVLADPLSGARFGPHRPPILIDAYDSFLRDPQTAASLRPEVVIRLGAIPTSKPLQQFLAAHPGKHHVLIDPGPPRDPFHIATSHLQSVPSYALRQLSQQLLPTISRPDATWIARWQNASEITSAAIAEGLAVEDVFSEGRTLAEVAAALPANSTLVVGNSMPVRDADTYIRGDRREITIVANRGANGIDGVVSSALGAAAVSEQPTVLVVGDLSFYHDMNGLLAAQQFGINATIVVLNNNGGGIFSFLPQADALDTHTFELLFGTPIDLNVQRAAELYGARFARLATWKAFRSSVCHALQCPGLSVIEVVTDRARNVQQHRAIAARVTEALRQSQGERH